MTWNVTGNTNICCGTLYNDLRTGVHLDNARNVVNLTTSLPGANTLDMYNVDNVASWATKRNITHGSRRSANTIWPSELLTPIVYVQGIIRTVTLCTEVSSGHALLTLW